MNSLDIPQDTVSWQDLDYWYLRFCRYWDELNLMRIQDRKALLFTLGENPEQLGWLVEPVRADLYQARSAPSETEFANWWGTLDDALRRQMMHRYSVGLTTVLEEHRQMTQAALRKFVRQ